MSEIILNWLNDQIQLSKRITNFEEDFNNGYLFGELLGKYNQQLNFSEFKNKEDKKSKLQNFSLLFDTFNSLGVTYNSLIANDIINKKVGVAKKLLYQLKMHLEKTSTNAFTKLTKMTKTLSPLKKIKVSKDQYDKVDKQHFVNQLNQMHPAQKTINMEKVQKKYSDFHQQQKYINTQLAQKEQQNKLLEQKRFRDKQRQNLKKTTDFRNEWQRSNMQKWSANMTVRNMQNEKDDMYRTKLEHSKVQNKTMSDLNANKAMNKDIDMFEKKNLKSKKPIIDDSDQSEHEQQHGDTIEAAESLKKQSKLSSKLKFNRTQKQLLSSLSLKKKQPAQVSQEQKHQRQKKRRKMIVQQNKRYQLIEISRRQKYILSTIQQTSKQQKQLEYQIWRIWSNKQIIKQNKHLQQQKQKQKKQVKEINERFKREELLKSYRQQHDGEVKQAVRRQQTMLKHKQVDDRKKKYLQCRKMVEQFIEITESCFLYQQQNNQQGLNDQLMGHLFAEFVQEAQSQENKAELELSNYIHGKGDWKLKVKRSQEQPTDPTLDNAVPANVTNNYTLGNILRLLYENKYKKIQSNQVVNKSAPSAKSVIALMGLEFSGKHLAAQALSENFGYNIIEIQSLIFNKITEYEQYKHQLSEVSEQTIQLVSLAYSGKQIPNELIINLVNEQINKNERSVLINYPITYKQSTELVKMLANVETKDNVEKGNLEKKIQQFSRLVWPTESKIVERPIRQCGLDVALWIDINDRTSFDRSLGRRYIDDKIVHISDDIANSVNFLKDGQKASSQILKNHQKTIEKQKIKQFLSQFGIEVIHETITRQPQVIRQSQAQQFKQGNEQNPATITNITENVAIEKFVRKSWQGIDGHCPIPELQSRVINVLEDTLKIKTMKREQQQQNLRNQQIERNKQIQVERLEQQIKSKCVLTTQQQVKSRLERALNSVSLDNEFVDKLCGLWDKVEQSTITSMKKIFTSLSQQEKDKNNYISSTKRNYINMLTRQDKKFSLVKQFQINYNTFCFENPDMLYQEYTKDELHQRVGDLQDQLYDLIQQKKDEAVEQRKNIMQSGWLESQLQQFNNCVRIMLQTELNRYNSSQKILSDFYSKKYSVPQTPYQQAQTQIPYDASLQLFTKEYAFPRLQKLISQTLRIFNKQQQVVDDKNKKGGKAPPKKQDKKAGKKVEVQEPKQPTAQQLQLKRTVNIQKSIFRYRLGIIQQFSLKRLSQLVKQSQNLSKDLQTYYLYTYEIENKTIMNISKIFRNKIERQEKIENEVQINYVDVIITEHIRNFQKQKPIILPAQQPQQQDRFTIANILQLLKFISNESESKEKISTKRLIYLFNMLKNNSTEIQLLPTNWKGISQQQLQSFILNLDREGKGSVELWKIFLFIAMSHVTVPSQKQLSEYLNNLTQYGTQNSVEKGKFVATPAWFDQKYNQVENVRTFKRNQLLKEILFDIFKTPDFKNPNHETLQAETLVQKLVINSWFNTDKEPSQNSYFEYAFA